MENTRFIYADNAATTKVSPRVLDAMLPFFNDCYGNPSSVFYSKGQEANTAVTSARERIAKCLGCKPNEIYFTASGSEADNWAIKGTALAFSSKGKHIISSKFEHHAVLHTLKALEKLGFEVTYVDVNQNGVIDPADVEKAIRPDTILIAIMYANNEIGTIQPIPQIAAIAKSHGILCFTDAVQAVGQIPVNASSLGVDMLSLSGHKIHAPKGIGLLYIRSGVRIKNLIDGGGQERGRRAGTENVPYIMGLAQAIEDASANMSKKPYVTAMRDRLIDGIMKIPYTHLNGDRYKRLPGTVNFSFEFIEGESIILLLNSCGICASTGSACSTASLEPSHVLLSIGLPHEMAHGSLRLSINEEITPEDIDYIIEKVRWTVERLRSMSPLFEKIEKGQVG